MASSWRHSIQSGIWYVASRWPIGGVIGWRHCLPSINCMFMPLFSRHCRMMWCVWRHIVASCFILLIPFSGVICSVFGWFGSCLLTECNRLHIIARSPPPARYSRANSVGGCPHAPTYIFFCLFVFLFCLVTSFLLNSLHCCLTHLPYCLTYFMQCYMWCGLILR